MRTVLILAYSWPPDASVGSVRPVYLARQLVRFGWRPIVITVRERYYELLNTAGIKGADLVFLIRTHCLPNPRHAYLWAKKLLNCLHHSETTTPPASLKASDKSTHDEQKISKQAPGLLRRTILSLLHTPDEFLGWLPFAIAASLRATMRYRPTCVISTGPPFTSHLVALVLKKICGITWVADFRDPWSWNEVLLAEITGTISNRINLRLEKMVILGADRIVCVTPAMTEKYRRLYPNLPDNKWVTITNGYDLDELVDLEPVEKSDRFTISYVGVFDYSRTPQLLLRAVGELIAEGRLDRQKLTLRFVGSCQYAGGRPLVEMIAENKLDGIIEIVGFVPRTEALREILRANVLVLLGTQRFTVAAKTYEYMAAGNPILAIVEEGAEADLIRYVGCGRVVAPTDVEGAKDAIAFWYNEYLQKEEMVNEHLTKDAVSTDEFSWTRLGARYASVLEECCKDQ